MATFDGPGHTLDPECPWCSEIMDVIRGRFVCSRDGYTEELATNDDRKPDRT